MDDKYDSALQTLDQLRREVAFLKHVWENANMKPEMANLMNRHFGMLREVAHQVAGLVQYLTEDLTEEQLVRYQERVHTIMELLGTVPSHSVELRSIYDRLPDRHEMLLATADVPPWKM